jgi:hypothetical protein
VSDAADLLPVPAMDGVGCAEEGAGAGLCQLPADGLRQRDAAAIGRGAGYADMRDIGIALGKPHRRVARKAARREDDRPVGTDVSFPVADRDIDAAHPTIRQGQLQDFGVQDQWYAAAEEGGRQLCHESAADDEPGAALPARQPVAEITAEQGEAASCRYPVATEGEQGLDVSTIDHHPAEDQMTGERRAQVVQSRAKRAAVKGKDIQCPAGRSGASKLGMIVRCNRAR